MEYHKRFDPMYSDARNRIQNFGNFSFFSSTMVPPLPASHAPPFPLRCSCVLVYCVFLHPLQCALIRNCPNSAPFQVPPSFSFPSVFLLSSLASITQLSWAVNFLPFLPIPHTISFFQGLFDAVADGAKRLFLRSEIHLQTQPKQQIDTFRSWAGARSRSNKCSGMFCL